MAYKHFFLLAAVAGAALAGCTKTELIPANDKDIAVSFNTAVGVPTKAAEDINSAKYPNSQNFKVWALYTQDKFDFETTYTTGDSGNSALFMNGVEQEYDSDLNGWHAKGTDKYYWPKAGYLSFWAVSPETVSPTVSMGGTSNTISVASFSITDVAPLSSNDLLFSDIVASKQATDYDASTHDDATTGNDNGFTEYEGVNIYFHHALSRIEFKAKLGSNINKGEKIKITKVQVNKAKGSGSLAAKATKALGEGATLTSGFSSGDGNVAWTIAEDATAVALNPVSSETEDLTTTAKAIGEARLVIPQATTAVEFTVTIQSEIGNVKATKDYTYALGTAHDNAWKWGKKYVYTLIVNEDEIIFDPAVAEWDTVNADEHNL